MWYVLIGFQETMAPSPDEVLNGFQINWVTIRDIDSGEILWNGNEDYSDPNKVMEIKFPKRILKSRAISREMHFSSIESWERLHFVHTIFYKGKAIDELQFDFGPVVSNSNNTLQSIIEAAPEVKMITPDIMSGNVEIFTSFYNNKTLVTRSKIKLFYV